MNYLSIFYYVNKQTSTQIYKYVYIYIQSVPGGKDLTSGVFLRSNYTDITQNTYIQSSMVTEILATEV